MKKLILSLTVFSLLAVTSCKKTADVTGNAVENLAESAVELATDLVPTFENEAANTFVGKVQAHYAEVAEVATSGGDTGTLEAIKEKGLEIAKEQVSVLNELPEKQRVLLTDWVAKLANAQ